jgi:non-specific serine/threonine protein kinase
VALPSFKDGVWFVPLAVAATGDRVVPLVATTLNVSERSDEPLEDSVTAYLRDRELLLVLDNCEHVLASAAALVERLLASCPRLRVLVTSREFLGVRGEHAVSTPPLSVSDDSVLAGVSDAVELFLVRAAAAAPNFDSRSADRDTIAKICRRLDGLPLAIELAAARLRALSLEQLATRLDDRFRLLTGARQTLEEVVAWSSLDCRSSRRTSPSRRPRRW